MRGKKRRMGYVGNRKERKIKKKPRPLKGGKKKRGELWEAFGKKLGGASFDHGERMGKIKGE